MFLLHIHLVCAWYLAIDELRLNDGLNHVKIYFFVCFNLVFILPEKDLITNQSLMSVTLTTEIIVISLFFSLETENQYETVINISGRGA